MSEHTIEPSVSGPRRTRFRVTYDVVIEESRVTYDVVTDGDYAESGFYSRGGWTHDDSSDWTLREVVSEFGRNSLTDCGRSFYSDAQTNYRTGEDTTYAVHPPRSITRASYARLRRILAWKG